MERVATEEISSRAFPTQEEGTEIHLKLEQRVNASHVI
jgi:hypothetical protein